jgi:hypothetical protein
VATETPPYWQQWYEVVEESELWQGDIIPGLYASTFPQDLPVRRVPPKANEKIPVKGGVGDWIVMSASCDLGRGPSQYPHVLVGRVLPATAEKLNVKPDDLNETLEVMRRGWDLRRFLLAPYPPFGFQLSFVQFRHHLTLPLNYLERACSEKRLRLRPPFREWFGIWVGSGFSRVGLDDNTQQILPPFVPSTRPAITLMLDDLEETAAVPARLHVPWPRWLRWLENLLARIQGR